MDMKTLAAFLTMCAVAFAADDRDRIAKIGNDLRPSASGVDVQGAIFLLNKPVAADGIIFAFSAFFRSDKASRFQLYRPTGDKSEYRLIGEVRHIPSVVYSREDVYIESKLTQKCLQVHSGDRLGVFMEDAPGAVAYTFDTTGNLKTLGHTPKGNDSVIHEIGAEIAFDTLTFPYEFNMAAYVDTEMGHYKGITADDIEVECHKGLLIPDYTDVLLPDPSTVTGEPGATGATGPAGHQGVQGFAGVGSTGPQGEQGEDGGIGSTGPQGEAGPLGGTGMDGPKGEEGKSGATGPKGEKGEKGERGMEGPAGPVILPEDIKDMIQASTDEEEESVMKSPMLMFSLVGWLIILTILVIILIAVIVTVNRRNKKDPYTEDSEAAYSKADAGRMESLSPCPLERANSVYVTKHAEADMGEVNPAWVSTLKTESESHVMNQTIEDDSITSQNGNYSYTDSCANSRMELVTDSASLDSSEFTRPEMVY